MKLVKILMLLLVASTANADALSDELGKMCNKIKQCTLEKMKEHQELTDQMKTMIEQQLDKSCESVEKNYKSGIAALSEHYDAALACVKTMAAASCADLLDNDKKSAECQKFEDMTYQE